MPSSVAPVTIADHVYSFLEDEILAGRLPGGSRLRVRQLATLSGTSPMPVRHAIARLEQAGLAERQPYKGAVVKQFSSRELIEIYDVRLLLEPRATRLGAERVSAAGLAQMRKCLTDQRQAIEASDPKRSLAADVELLNTLYAASGNETLRHTINNLWSQSNLYRLSMTGSMLDAGTAQRLVEWNEKIVESTESGAAIIASAWVEESITTAVRELTQSASVALSRSRALDPTRRLSEKNS